MSRAFITAVAGLVPFFDRKRWLEEWRAEHDALASRLGNLGPVGRQVALLRFSLGALPHAFALRGSEGEPLSMIGMMMGRDFKYALRSFGRTPGFTVVAVLTLALGIGATTAMFSVLDGVLLRPLPYENPNQLVMIGSTSPRFPGLAPVSPADFMDWREQNTTFSHMIATEGWSFDLTDGDAPVRVNGAGVTHGFFELLGVAPMMGRGILPTDDVTGAEPVAVISAGLWERRYSSSPDIIGRRIFTADQTYTVVGVMSPDFMHPEAFWSDDIEMWIPEAMTGSDLTQRNGRFLQVMGRLKPESTIFEARQEMTAIALALAEQFPANQGRETLIEPLQDETIGDVGSALTILMGAVGMLLLIACVNVANLFTARATGRSREIAVRAALGAGTARIRRQLLTEGVSLSLVGGLAGVALAYGGVAAFRTFNPGGIPRAELVGVDGRVLVFAFLVSVLTGIGFALAPAFRLGRPGSLGALRDGGRAGSEGGGRSKLRYGLVAVEIGLAVVLMVGAGLFVNSFLRLRSVDPGFDPQNAITMSVNLNSGYDGTESQVTYFRQLTEQLSAIPGVESVSYASTMPYGDDRWITGVQFEGREFDRSDPDVAEYVRTAPRFFETMGIDVVAGREFSDGDDASVEPVVVVNEAFARRYFPGEDPVGQRVGLGRRSAPTWNTVIGVAADINRRGLDQPADPELYLSPLQDGINVAHVVVRHDGDATQVASLMRQRTWELDATLPLEFSTLEAYLTRATNQPQFYTQLFSAFALVALVLAGVGVYGTMSYAVGQRTRELGIRVALGAESGQVLRLVARQGLIVTGVGLGVGLVGAVASSRVVESLLFGVEARDPATFAVAALFLGAVALLACYVPARRAGRADPMVALRSE